MKLIFSFIKKHIATFSIAIVFLTIESICDLLQPMIMSKIVDGAVANGDISLVLWLGGLMLLIALVGASSAVTRNFFASKTSQTIGKEMRCELYKKVQTFSFENLDRLEPASLITRITNDVTQIQNFINGCMRILVKAPIICVGAIFFIVIQTPAQIPVILTILVIVGFLIAGNMKLGYSRFGKMQKNLDSLNNESREYLNSVRVVKAFGQEEQEQERFSEVADNLANASVAAMRVNAIFNPFINFTVNAGIVVILFVGGYRGQGNIEIGKIMASVNYMTQVLFALGMVSNILNSMVRASASSKRLKEVFDETPTMTEPTIAVDCNLDKGIVFDNVTFTYPNTKQPVLENISFKINKGTKCGIIGSTGSGKSTMMQLMMRFYDPTEGAVIVGGENIRRIPTKQLRGKIALVSQKPLLFTGTIKQNIKWGNKDADDNEILRATKIAQADGFISELKNKYQTILGQAGVNLSGGQKQRLSIARAIVRNPEILILDDCTSALDATTEVKVMEGIAKYAKGITTFVISQRIASVMRADCILCLDNGKIVGNGTHEELMGNCSVYREIYDSQIGGEYIG